jgi:hypothetical protein
MFNLSAFIRSLFILTVIVLVLFTATKLSGPVKDNLGNVLGVSVSEKSADLPENLQKDVSKSVTDVTKKAMQTDASDVVNVTSRVNKVIRDYQALQKEIQKRADEFFKENDKK